MKQRTSTPSNGRRQPVLLAGFVILAVSALLKIALAETIAVPEATTTVDPAEIATINQELQEKRQAITDLEQKTATVEKTLAEQRRSATTIKGQITLLDQQIADHQSSIQLTSLELDRVNLEMELLQLTIDAKEEQATDQRMQLSDVIRRINRQNHKTPLEIALIYDSFSDFWNQVKSAEGLQASLQEHYETLQGIQQALEIQYEESTAKEVELSSRQAILSQQQVALEQQQNFKASLLANAESLEQQYQQQLGNLQEESKRVNTEIASLEQRAREKLGGGDQLGTLVASPLIWPLDPTRGVTAEFHDPSYPFRCTTKTGSNCIGEHSGIDIRAYQGTSIRAAADGYVAIARNLDWVRDGLGRILRPAYNYISILHAGNLSTVYGHLSVVSVTEDQFVKQGQIIGVSGATPGTAGAGSWTTGPHLHFEVRENGIPVNARTYLPR